MLEEPTVWTDSGKPMTAVRRNPAGMSSNKIHEWCTDRLDGEVVVTPRYVWFENATEATLFRIGFNDGY